MSPREADRELWYRRKGPTYTLLAVAALSGLAYEFKYNPDHIVHVADQIDPLEVCEAPASERGLEFIAHGVAEYMRGSVRERTAIEVCPTHEQVENAPQ